MFTDNISSQQGVCILHRYHAGNSRPSPISCAQSAGKWSLGQCYASGVLGRRSEAVALELARCTRSVHNDLVTIIGSDGDKHFNKTFLLTRSCYTDSPPANRATDLQGNSRIKGLHKPGCTWKAGQFPWQKACCAINPDCLMLVGCT